MIASPSAVFASFLYATVCLADDVLLSIDVTHPPGESFADAIATIKSAGATATSLSLFRDDLDPAAGRYAPRTDWPAIANKFYPSAGLGLTVTFSVIDTVSDGRRADLTGLNWDNPEVIRAFAAHLADVLGRMRDVEIVAVSVGNEVDGLLRSDADVAAFSRLLASARRTVEDLRPGVPVGTKLTYAGLTGDPERWRPLLAASSALQLTYYPVTAGFAVRPDLVVADDLAAMARLANGLPIHILESGYPTDGCGAEADGQLDFVRDLISGAHEPGYGIELVSVTWLTDLQRDAIADLERYYGIAEPCFGRFVASIGLRTRTGAPKPALRWLQGR